ncbi:hypothetical protein DV737_g269, partial [Chaetothyriales sp. CBS 132003]
MAAAARHWEQDRDSTVYIGNLDERVTDALVFELFLQSGRIANVHLPKDRVTQTHQGYGFVEFTSEEDADYSARVMNGVRLFGKPIRVNKASADKTKAVEVGAELFVGNLDPLVDERILFETFGRFGTLVAQPKVARDEANLSKGYGFVSYADFGASDDAIANMNGQYLMNKEISVQYAYKKDGKGERHGDEAERMLAAQAKQHGVQPTPATIPVGGPLFATQPPAVPAQPHLQQPPHMANGFNAVPPPSVQAASRAPSTAIPPPPALAAPPSGLPARPPPSQAGYGGPQGFVPGFGPMPQVPATHQLPAGFSGPPTAGHIPAAGPQPIMPFAPPPGFAGPQSGAVPPPPPLQGGHGVPPPMAMPPGFQGFGVRK